MTRGIGEYVKTARVFRPENPVFHVTPIGNVNGIEVMGVDPRQSRGLAPVSWWVELPRLAWAIAHVSFKWGVQTDDLVIYTVTSPADQFLHTRWQLVYMTRFAIRPDMRYSMWTALELIQSNMPLYRQNEL
jgi:hypothetical protein